MVPDAGNTGHVWTMAPDGTVRQASTGPGERVRFVLSNGMVAYYQGGVFSSFNANPQFFSLPPYGNPVRVGTTTGGLRSVGGQWYYILGRTAFKVNF